MAYVTANWELPIYQVIGPVIRVHWNYSQRTVDFDFMDEPTIYYDAEEAVVPLDADRDTFVELVNAEGGDGEALADGWYNMGVAP
jgi:hypothetical protein